MQETADTGAPGGHHPQGYSSDQMQTKYEDCILAEPADGTRQWSVFALFDGHHGDLVSQLLASRMLSELSKRMPALLPAARLTAEAATLFAGDVRRAVAGAFVALDIAVREDDCGRYGGAGSTATVAVQAGPLLTVANVGNSRCAVDVGVSSVELTVDHKLGECEEELERLNRAPGVRIAQLKSDGSGPADPGESGVGPLRVWPGGLHVSRAIGDADAGACVVPYPHIKQVLLPRRATRMVIATGTVWASFETHHKAMACIRGVSLQNAAAALMQKAASKWRAYHDRSVLVVDFVPDASSSFKSQVRLDRLSRSSTIPSRPPTFSRFTPPLDLSLGLPRWSPGSRDSSSGSPQLATTPAASPRSLHTPRSHAGGLLAALSRVLCIAPEWHHEDAQGRSRGSGNAGGDAGGQLLTKSSSAKVYSSSVGLDAATSDAGISDDARLVVVASVDAFRAYARGRYGQIEDVLQQIDQERPALLPPRKALSAGDLVMMGKGSSGRYSWEQNSPTLSSLTYA